MYEKILVPLDGSDSSEKALPYANILASRLGSEITLFSVCTNTEFSMDSACEYLREKDEELQSLGIKASYEVTSGDIAGQIIKYSEKNRIDLVIMSTRGKSGYSYSTRGSVCSKVMQESYLPLLLIKPISTVPETNSMWKILVPLDGSHISETILPMAAEITRALYSEIILFQVNEAGTLVHVSAEHASQLDEYREEAVRDTENGIRKYLKKLRTRMKPTGLDIKLDTAIGKAAEQILNYTESNDISLIAMSTHGQSGYSQWAFGSVAYKVVEGTSKPVLLLRPKPTILGPGKPRRLKFHKAEG